MPEPDTAEPVLRLPRDEIRQQLLVESLRHDLLSDLLPHQRAVFGVLAVADRHGLDPVPLLLQLSDEMPSEDCYWARSLAEQIQTGITPSAALSQNSRLLTPLSQFAWRQACDLSLVSQLNQELLGRAPEVQVVRTDTASEPSLPKYWRLFFRIVCFMSLFGFMLQKIVPEFKAMLEEFKIEMPVALRLLVYVGQSATYWWLLTPVLLLILLLASFPMTKNLLQRWSPIRWQQRFSNPTVARRRALALVLQTRSTDLDDPQSTPFTQCLTELFPRFPAVRARIEQGQSAWAAFLAEKVISPRESNLLQQTQSPEARAWMLRWSAANQQNSYETKTAFGLRFLSTAVQVALVALVFLICLAIFTTLINLINSLILGTTT